MSDRTLLDTGLFVLNFARRATLGLLEGIEGEAFVNTFAKDGGNAAYIVGHIAYTDDMTLKVLAGKPSKLDDRLGKLFGGGAEPTQTLADYPSQQELVELMADRRDALVAWFSSLSDAELTAPVEGDFAQFGDTRAKLMTSIAWHEGLHTGQLAVIRRQLELPRVLG